MSWQSYVDETLMGSGNITQAAIVGLDGGVWATTPGLDVSSNSSEFNGWFPGAPSNITVAGEEYLRLRADEKSIYGKKGNSGCALVKTAQCIIIGLYDGSKQPGQAQKTVEKLGDYLMDQGY